jgi:hypothetical protein
MLDLDFAIKVRYPKDTKCVVCGKEAGLVTEGQEIDDYPLILFEIDCGHPINERYVHIECNNL